jgi:hypothetical protein
MGCDALRFLMLMMFVIHGSKLLAIIDGENFAGEAEV